MPVNVELLTPFNTPGFDIVVTRPNLDLSQNSMNKLQLMKMEMLSCKWITLLYDLHIDMVLKYIKQNSNTNLINISYIHINDDIDYPETTT